MQLAWQNVCQRVSCLTQEVIPISAQRTRRRLWQAPRAPCVRSLATPEVQQPQAPECVLGAQGGSTPDWRERAQLLIGDEGLKRLADARVLIVGLGGVGSYAAEFLARYLIGVRITRL